MMNLIPTEYWEYSLTDAIRGLFAAVSSGRATLDAEIQISELGPCIPVRSARAGIVVALKALSLLPGASVAVPLYCCPVVLTAIKTAGCRPRFIDVDPETYCLSASHLAEKSCEVDAVIAVHMFGNMCNMPALRKAAPGKPFIEDCAQALGARLHGKAAGSFGDIAVFSFRSGKCISAGEGGALYCNRADLQARVSELIQQCPSPGRLDECVHVIKTYIRSQLRSRPLWGMIGSWLWSAYVENVSFASQAPVVMGRMYETDRRTAVRRLAIVDGQIDKQRLNADYYARNLKVDSAAQCRETPDGFFNRLQYPVLLPTSRQCEQMSALLRREQISTARPYKDIATLAAMYYGYTGDCPLAEQIARSVLVIPCNYSLNGADVERIAGSINRAWAEVALRGTSIEMPLASMSAGSPDAGDGPTMPELHHSS